MSSGAHSRIPDRRYAQIGKVTGHWGCQVKTLKLNLSPGDRELEWNVVEAVNGTMVSHYRKGFTITG